MPFLKLTKLMHNYLVDIQKVTRACSVTRSRPMHTWLNLEGPSALRAYSNKIKDYLFTRKTARGSQTTLPSAAASRYRFMLKMSITLRYVTIVDSTPLVSVVSGRVFMCVHNCMFVCMTAHIWINMCECKVYAYSYVHPTSITLPLWPAITHQHPQ